MNMKLTKHRPITAAYIISIILTLAAVLLYHIIGDNYMLRVLIQAGLCMTTILNGFKYFIYEKNKFDAYALWIASASLLYVTFYTTYVGLKYNLFKFQ